MLKSKEVGAIEAGNITAVDLLQNHNAIELIDELCSIIQNKKETVRETIASKPIPVTEEEFERIKSMFRVKGFDADGNVTKRGRKPKSSESTE